MGVLPLDGAWDYKDQPAEFWDQYKTEFPDGCHVRIHPLLHWTEIDIWRYTQREKIPVVPLYFARDGKRYRSLGEKNITFPVDSNASNIEEIITELETTKVSERSGRSMDTETEDSFEKHVKHVYFRYEKRKNGAFRVEKHRKRRRFSAS